MVGDKKPLQKAFDQSVLDAKVFVNQIKDVGRAANNAIAVDPKAYRQSLNTIAGLESRYKKFQDGFSRTQIGGDSFNRLKSAVEQVRTKLDEARKSGEDFQKQTLSIKAGLASLAGGFTTRAITSEVKSLMDEAQKAQNTLSGLTAVIQYKFGREAVPEAISAVNSISKELNLNKEAITAAMRNFTAMGYSVTEASKLIKANADIGSVLRQSNYTLAESIEVVSQGYKAGNSILSDATGIQTNISKMLDTHGMKLDDLNDATKSAAARQVLLNETLRETEAFQGRAAEQAGGYAGALGRLDKSANETQVALGKLYQESLVPILNLGSEGVSFLPGLFSNGEKVKNLENELILLRESLARVPEGSDEWKKIDSQIKKTYIEIINTGPSVSHFGKSLLVAGTAGLTFYTSLITITKGLELAGVAGAANWTKILGPFALGATALVFTIDIVERFRKEGEQKDTEEKGRRLKERFKEDLAAADQAINQLSGASNLGYAVGAEKIEKLRKNLSGLGFTAEETEKIFKRNWLTGKQFISSEEVNRWRKAFSDINKEESGPKAPTGAPGGGGKGKLKEDLSEQKRIIEEFWKANPTTVKLVGSLESQSFEYLKKQLIEFSNKEGAKIPLTLDGKSITPEKIQNKEQLEKVVQEISKKYNISPDVVLKLKPENLRELDSLLSGARDEIDRKVRSGALSPKEGIKLHAQLEDAKTFDQVSAKLQKFKSDWEQTTGPLTQTESQIVDISQQINVATNKSQGFLQSVTAWGKAAAGAIAFLSAPVTQVLQAQAQLVQVQSQNQIQQVQFYGQAFDRIIDANLQAFLASQDEELAKLQEKLDAMEEAEREYEERKQERRDAEAQRIKEENEALYNEDALKLEEKYNQQITALEQESLDEELFNQRKAELFDRLQKDKQDLKDRYDKKTVEQIDKANKDQDAKDEKKKKEDEEKARAIAEQQKKIEADKTAATAKAEQDKQNAKKLTSYIEWQAGKTAFEANKQAQVAQAAFGIAQSAVQGAITFASSVAGYTAAGAALAGPTLGASMVTMPALGVATGAVLGGIVAGAGMTASGMALSAAQSQNYPPWMGFSIGGLVEGGIPGKDSVPALLTPREVVVPETGWADIRKDISDSLIPKSNIGAANINIEWMDHSQNYTQIDKEALLDYLLDELLKRLTQAGVVG
ncbi:primosomal protein [Leptospira kmetyi]|uniref:Primosomal protein n=3 Tax=Leptospira kmetyi TaxID=408139 RepID=A0ABX4N9D3_9LEPT|nr:primosomal protein [Leptospira kmetyi]PJZ39541.1 primosomal protein [Leptospira kmetyi]